ncbi:hypothetical protein JCM8097_006946 [Rhodosporidiobolus ruineniae]
MLSAATNRLRGTNGSSSSSSSTLTPAQRSERRLSRLSPSEFDSILDSHDTKHLHTSGRDENQLGVAPDLPPSPQHSPDLARNSPARMPIPPGLAPDPLTPDTLKRRSMFRSTGTASSNSDLSSLLRQAKEGSGRIGSVPNEEQEVLDDGSKAGGEEGDGAAYEDADESDLANRPTASSPPRAPRSRSTTSPSATRTLPRPQTADSQLSVPSAAPDSRDSTVASRTSASGDKPRLSSMSTFSTGSYVHVPFPSTSMASQAGDAPPAPSSRGQGSSGGLMNGSNASVTSLGAGIGFDFSPRRKKSNAGAEDDGKLSISSTMRKTSRFFRKFGGSASKNVPSTAADASFASTSSSLAPPVPAIPSSYNRGPSTARSPASLASQPSPSLSSPSTAGSPVLLQQRRPSSARGIGSTGAISQPLARDESQNSLASQQSALTASSGKSRKSTKSTRRRSLSLNSALPPATPSSPPLPSAVAGATLAPAPASSTRSRRPSASPRIGTGEDDQLRRELRQWRLGVDGVLGVGLGGSSASPTPGSSPNAAATAKGNPAFGREMGRSLTAPAEVSPTVSRVMRTAGGAGIAELRRGSLPEGKELPPTPGQASAAAAALAGRSASLPTSSLFPPSSMSASAPTLTSPASTSSNALLSSSTRTASPAPSNASNDTLSASTGALKRHSIAEPEGIGLGLAAGTAEEGRPGGHGRDATLVPGPGAPALTPVRSRSEGAEELELDATPTRPAPGQGQNRRQSQLLTPLSTDGLAPAVVAHAPSPTSSVSPTTTTTPGTGAGGKLSNQRAGVMRGSIVGYPPVGAPSSSSSSAAAVRSLPTSLAGSTASLASSSTPAFRKGKKPATAVDEAEGMSEEEVQEKARELAKKAWDEDEGFLERRKIATWLGSAGRINVAALRFYIDNFDFTGLRLDVAFRRLCAKLYLKAETQQVDRILEQFSRRYFEDNPKSVYGSADVVHAVSYSLLLLNTDLHVVDTTTRMTRPQFIRNTLEAIRAQTDLEDEVIQTPLSPTRLFSSPNPSVAEGTAEDSSVFGSHEAAASHKSVDRPRTAASVRSGSGVLGKDSPSSSTLNLPVSPPTSRPATASGSPVKPPAAIPIRSESSATVNSTLSSKSLEANLQAALKDMYNAIKSQPIYQSSGSSASALHLPGGETPAGRPSFSLAPGNSPYATWGAGSNPVSRAASRRSGVGPGTSTVSVGSGSAGSSYKRSSIRGMGAFLGAGSSSLELTRSTSPTPSTNTSLSDEHWSTAFGASSQQHHHVPTIGFANSLSHTIIREQQEDDAQSDRSSSISVSSAELALLGAPWAKEGILHRKHYWETVGKRAKDKSWVQAFVVISAGELKMFRFDQGGGMRTGFGGIGGGDWTANASSVGAISLIHALCSAMPAPGYSRDRPHCFVLTLPSGGSYFFQAGTPDLVAEWVATCNYWSARLSKEPLSGGVSNMEYGWNRAEPKSPDPSFGDRDDDDYEEIASIRSGHSRVSHAGSAFSHHGSISGGGSGNSNDRIHINDWKPPQVPLQPSQLHEEAQLEALKRHAQIVKAELAHHNTLRAPMLKLYSSRSSNATKALANWERKSQHLLTESVKWTTYIDALTSAIRLRSIQRGKKEVEAMLAEADEDDEDDDDLVASLSPYEQPPAVQQSKTDDEQGSQKRDDSRTPSRVSSSRDEFYDSNDATPPP